MSRLATVPTAAWAVLTMEMATGFVLASMLMPTGRGWSVLDPFTLVLLLPVGYLAVHTGRVPDEPRARILYGLGAATLLRAPFTPWPTLADSSLLPARGPTTARRR